MCGILGIVNKRVNNNSEALIKASAIIKHRGPDDEGFMTWLPGDKPKIWAGADTAASTHQHWHYETLLPNEKFKVGFGHRRLSILDLSPAGHQPMVHEKAGLMICFNGEVYNYLEIRAELEATGKHKFVTGTDTEVILHAWEEWGVNCLNRFNGMFAFLMLDYNRNELFAVRDRFGVKPLFIYNGTDSLYFASEIKQIRTNPNFDASLNEPRIRQFLATGAINHSPESFYKQITSIPGGHYLHMSGLNADGNSFKINKWYQLSNEEWKGSYNDAVVRLRELLISAVDVRLRSDVKVGSCLSGGLDSSSIVCIAADLLKARGDHEGQETVTARYEAAKFDEWKFALEVIKKTNAHPHETFPSFAQLEQEAYDFLWHQDEPTGSTSQFSQWAVFKATHQAGLKVMIDGQGADEQLAGYGGNDLPLYTGLWKSGDIASLIEEARSYKQEKGNWPIGFLSGGLHNSDNILASVLPKKLKIQPVKSVDWLRGGEPESIYPDIAKSLRDNLLRQLYHEPLPALLRYEDHNSMAWSVESRTPFMDYRLVEFTLGLPARYLLRNGVRKAILRDAMKGMLPEAVEKRKDKMGFVTPERLWLKEEGKQWFLQHAMHAIDNNDHLFVKDKIKAYVTAIANEKAHFSFLPWRLVALDIWQSKN